jgi:hypothetical protein
MTECHVDSKSRETILQFPREDWETGTAGNCRWQASQPVLCWSRGNWNGGMASDVTSDVTKAEFDHLKAREDVVEREVDGEKTVTRHILEQTRRNGDDLAAVKSHLDRHDQRFDILESRFDGLERQVAALRKDIPSIVGEVMRDVLRERDKKR